MVSAWSGPWPDLADLQNPGQATNPHTGDPEGEESWADEDRDDTTDVPCFIQPRTSAEPGSRDIVVGEWVSGWPADTTQLTSSTRIVWRGRTLQVDGEVAPIVIRGVVHHLEAPLKRWGETE